MLLAPRAMKIQKTLVKALALGLFERAFTSHAFAIASSSSKSSVSSFSTRTTATSSTKLSASKMDQSFPTWSYDQPCKAMEWNSLVEAPLTVEPYAEPKDADLVFIGVMAPPAETSDDDDDEDDDEAGEKEIPLAVLSGAAQVIDEELGGAITELMAECAKEFKNGAKMGSMTPVLRTVGQGKKRYVVLGLGPTPKEDAKDPYKGAGASLGKAIAEKCNSEKKVKSCAIVLPEVLASNTTTMKDFSTAFYDALYTDNRYRTGAKVKKPVEDLKEVKILSEGTTAPAEAIEEGKTLATGIAMAKDIVNAPHNVLNSLSLAETARRIAKESGGTIKCNILDKKECEKRGMGAFLGVARASETEPQFIHLTYTPPKGKVNKKIGIIGKGLLFDTGGYNIKTAMMEKMKFDCGGSAAVLGAARAIGALAPEGVEVHFCIAACENMINGKGMVPSDILTAMNGKTIEVMNTDAEGRLTMADALVFADKELGCERIIELSTLTGACMVALGQKICGLWSDNDDLAKELEAVSKDTGDKVWRMPMAKEYNDQLKSQFADLKNVGTRFGGAITAALFLQHFVDKKKPFAHIDIAGPVWDDSKGATGFGTKLVIEWVRRQGETNE